MKKFLLALTVAFASPAFAAEANLFNCKGEGVDVRMTLSSVRGTPTLKVDASSPNSENTPGGRLENVTAIETAMGLAVTGEFVEIADATLKYTLIVPHMIVNQTILTMSGNAMLVRSMTGGFIPPSSEMARVVETNKFTPMVCDASLVLF